MTEPTRVLLVEDNDYDVHRVEKALDASEVSEFAVSREARLVDAVERIEEGVPDLVLLDLGLPDSTGLDSLEVVLDHAPDLPVVVLTGLRDEATAMKAVEVGAHDYIVKDNLDSFNLSHSIRFALKRQRFAEEAESALRSLIGGEGSAASALIVGVANEIRASTSLVAENVSRVEDVFEDPRPREQVPRARSALDETTDELGRIDQLLKVLVRFFGTRTGEDGVSLREPTVAAVYLFQSATGERVGIDADLDPTPSVDGKAFRIQRLVLDLLKAVAGVVPDGTVLSVRTSGSGGAARLTVRAPNRNGGVDDVDLDAIRRSIGDRDGELLVDASDGLEVTLRLPSAE